MGVIGARQDRANRIVARDAARSIIKSGTNRCPCGGPGKWFSYEGARPVFACDACKARDEAGPRKPRSPDQPIPTIGELMRGNAKWVWVHCIAGLDLCSHSRPMTLAPFAILWGLDASSDLIRERLRCTVCGHQGVFLTLPSSDGTGMTASFPGAIT